MKFTRRETLIGFIGGFASLLLPPFIKNAFAKTLLTDEEAVAILKEIVNLVIPSNAKGGGAIALGVDEIVWKEITGSRTKKRKFLNGLTLLNLETGLRYAGKTFTEIDKQKKILLLKEISSSSLKSKYISAKSAKDIFSKIRNLTVDYYYSQNSAYKSIGFGGPSQYKGYPDYDQQQQG